MRETIIKLLCDCLSFHNVVQFSDPQRLIFIVVLLIISMRMVERSGRATLVAVPARAALANQRLVVWLLLS